jgi:hypothetical protein
LKTLYPVCRRAPGSTAGRHDASTIGLKLPE